MLYSFKYFNFSNSNIRYYSKNKNKTNFLDIANNNLTNDIKSKNVNIDNNPILTNIKWIVYNRFSCRYDSFITLYIGCFSDIYLYLIMI